MELNINRPLVVFDLEATGLRIGKDRIVEFSMIKLLPNGSQESWTQRINPEMEIAPDAQAVHGISSEELADQPTFAAIAKKLQTFIGNADLAGYNSNKFDIPMLAEEFLRVGVDFDLSKRHFIDVQNIFHQMEQRTLSAAYTFYCDKDLKNAHSADADTLATLEILKAQLTRYENCEYTDRKGVVSQPVVNNVEALAKFTNMRNNADLAGHIGFNDAGEEVFNFGKNKGKSVEAVFTKEPQYYDWMMHADFPQYTKKIITAIKLRRFNQH